MDSGNADGVDGVVEAKGANGVMYGTLSIDGKTWSGNWYNPDGVQGTFSFTLKDDKTFTGTYTQNKTTGNFVWNGNK